MYRIKLSNQVIHHNPKTILRVMRKCSTDRVLFSYAEKSPRQTSFGRLGLLLGVIILPCDISVTI